MITRDRLWTRDFVLITLTNLLTFTGFYFLLPTLPRFVLDVLGGDKADVGYIVGLYTAAAVLARPLAGYLLDNVGRRPVMLPALAGFALLMASYGLVAGLAGLFAVRVLQGLFWGGLTTGTAAVVADVVPPGRRGEGIGLYGLSTTVGMAVGPAVGLWILGDGNYGRLFLAAAGTGLLALALAGLIRYRPVRAPGPQPAPARLTPAALIDRASLPLGLVLFFVALAYGGVVTFITLYGDELGVANPGLFFLVYAAVLTATRPPAGAIFDRRGPEGVMAAGFLAMIAAFAVLGGWRAPAGFFLAAPLLGLGFGLVMPAVQAMVVNQAPPDRRGAASATFMTALDLGIGLGAVLLGAVAARLSTAGMYLASAAILLIPLAYFFAHVRHDYRRKLGGRGAGVA